MYKFKDWHVEFLLYLLAIIVLMVGLLFTLGQLEKQNELIISAIIQARSVNVYLRERVRAMGGFR